MKFVGKREAPMTLSKQRKLLGNHLNFAAAEAYKLLRTNLMFALPNNNECRVIGITSALRGEGKSTTSVNLAYTIAQTGVDENQKPTEDITINSVSIETYQ